MHSSQMNYKESLFHVEKKKKFLGFQKRPKTPPNLRNNLAFAKRGVCILQSKSLDADAADNK